MYLPQPPLGVSNTETYDRQGDIDKSRPAKPLEQPFLDGNKPSDSWRATSQRAGRQVSQTRKDP